MSHENVEVFLYPKIPDLQKKKIFFGRSSGSTRLSGWYEQHADEDERGASVGW
jgi:hypothetical protein